MVFGRIACIKATGSGLVFGKRLVLDAIVVAASKLLSENGNKKQIRADSFEGAVYNSSKFGVIGAIAGFIFSVELESGVGGRATMEFILSRPIPKEELDGMFWTARPVDPKEANAMMN